MMRAGPRAGSSRAHGRRRCRDACPRPREGWPSPQRESSLGGHPIRDPAGAAMEERDGDRRRASRQDDDDRQSQPGDGHSGKDAAAHALEQVDQGIETHHPLVLGGDYLEGIEDRRGVEAGRRQDPQILSRSWNSTDPSARISEAPRANSSDAAIKAGSSSQLAPGVSPAATRMRIITTISRR